MDSIEVPFNDLQYHLRAYRAQPLAEYSNAQRHVYFSPPMKIYITVRSKKGKAELEFTEDCPCSYDD
jgi:hypothetical protein